MRKIINKYCIVLLINPRLQEIFQKNPFVTYKRNKNLLEIIAGHTIKNRKASKTHSKGKGGKC